MQLFVTGNVLMGKRRLAGGVIFDQPAIYFYQQVGQNAMMTGAAVGGLIGGLIGAAVDKARQGKTVPKTFASDPDFQAFSPEVQNKVRNIAVYEKIPREKIVSVESKLGGFAFTTVDGRKFAITNLIKKNAMREFLEQHGYNVAMK